MMENDSSTCGEVATNERVVFLKNLVLFTW